MVRKGPLCEEGNHPMKFMEGWYSEYSCDVCGTGFEGERWHCPDHEADVCMKCGPECPQASEPSTPGTTRQVSGASGASVPRTPSAVSVTGAGAPLPEKRAKPDSETSSQRSQVSNRYEIPSTRQTSAASFREREPIKPVKLVTPSEMVKPAEVIVPNLHLAKAAPKATPMPAMPAMPSFTGMPELPGMPAAPTAFCEVGEPHAMKLTVGKYSEYSCDRCGGRLNEGQRWHCSEHEVDVCPACAATTPVVKVGDRRGKDGNRIAKVLVLLALLLPFYHIVDHRRQVVPKQPQPAVPDSGKALRPTKEPKKEPKKEVQEKPKVLRQKEAPESKKEPRQKTPSEEPPQKTDAEIQREIEDKAARLHKQALAQQARRHAAMRSEKKGWWAA